MLWVSDWVSKQAYAGCFSYALIPKEKLSIQNVIK